MEQGHEFLAKLGKTKLRPGGMDGTNWLMDRANLTKDSKVLEVACNRAVNMINIAKKYGCKVEGIDQFDKAIEDAIINIKKEGLENQLHVQKANAMNLPFEDESFDVVINEAMLTMLSNEAKSKCINEYFRVLKKGGILLTHDVATVNFSEENLMEMRKLLHISVSPLSEEAWINIFKEHGFKDVERKIGALEFLTKAGLIRDEGLEGFMKIVKNAVKPENIKRFFDMKEFFDKNHRELRYIVIASKK